jgi:hypothetical protein
VGRLQKKLERLCKPAIFGLLALFYPQGFSDCIVTAYGAWGWAAESMGQSIGTSRDVLGYSLEIV